MAIKIPSKVDINHLEEIVIELAEFSDNITNQEYEFLIDLFKKLKN